MSQTDKLRKSISQIKDLINQGETLSTIAEIMNCNVGLLHRVIGEYGLTPNKTYSKNKCQRNKDKILELFDSGESVKQISKTLEIERTTLSRFLKKNGRDTSKHRYNQHNVNINSNSSIKYNVDLGTMKNIDSPEKAYFAGLMYADGNVSDDTKTGRLKCIRISLKYDDAPILEECNRLWKNEKPLEVVKKGRQRAFIIHRKEACESMIKLGCVPRKTHILEFPSTDIVPKEFLPSFLAGYIMGDGSVAKKNRGTFSITGCPAFVHGCYNLFKDIVGEDALKIYFCKRSASLYVLRYAEKYKMLEWIYSQSNSFLQYDRKYKNYLAGKEEYRLKLEQKNKLEQARKSINRESCDISIKDLKVDIVDKKIAQTIIEKEHYLHKKANCQECFGLFYNNKIVGICMFGRTSSSTMPEHLYGDSCYKNIIELTRFWTDGGLPPNTESWFMSQCLKRCSFETIISYADIGQNHVGYIYQATNWFYIGVSLGREYYDIKSEFRYKYHRGTTYTAKQELLKYFDESELEKIKASDKHKYIYINASKKRKKFLLNNLKQEILQYPKQQNKCDDLRIVQKQDFQTIKELKEDKELSYPEIAEKLNEQNILSPTGEKWHRKTVSKTYDKISQQEDKTQEISNIITQKVLSGYNFQRIAEELAAAGYKTKFGKSRWDSNTVIKWIQQHNLPNQPDFNLSGDFETDKARLLELVKNGIPVYRIAQHSDYVEHTLRRQIEKLQQYDSIEAYENAKQSKMGWSQFTAKWCVEFRLGGLSNDQIAAKFNGWGVPTKSGRGKWNREMVHALNGHVPLNGITNEQINEFIQERLLKGYENSKIIQMLNEEGYRTPARGKKWSSKTFLEWIKSNNLQTKPEFNLSGNFEDDESNIRKLVKEGILISKIAKFSSYSEPTLRRKIKS